MPPQNSYIEILISCGSTRRWSLWELHMSWGWSPHEWNQRSYKRDPTDLPSCFHPVRLQWKFDSLQPMRRSSPDTMILDLTASRTMRHRSLKVTQSVVLCYSSLNGLRWMPTWRLYPNMKHITRKKKMIEPYPSRTQIQNFLKKKKLMKHDEHL